MHPIRRILRRHFGLDVHRFHPQFNDVIQLVNALSYHRVTVVLDVGANTGQFGESIREGGYAGRIVSYEPQTAAHEKLMRRPWTIAPRMAIGERNGTVTLNISKNSVSSSVLQITQAALRSSMECSYVSAEATPLRTLDEASAPYVSPSDTPFVKIDVQGYQSRVLDGAREILPRCVGLIVELSLVPMYEGEDLFDPIVRRLEHSGFALWGLLPGCYDLANGRMLQCDGVFFRTAPT